MAEAGEVSETNQTTVFSFVVSVSADPGEDVILPVRLSPETNAVSMNISWYRGTELIYQYKNGQERTNNDCEGRVSLSIQELERGNLSLTLRNVQESDSGEYTCIVDHDGCQKTIKVHLQVRGERLQREIMELQRRIMELQRQIKKLKLEGQLKKLELEKQTVELEMERQIMEIERQIEDLEREKNELPSRTHTLHVLGPTLRRRNSIHGLPPNLSEEDDTPETPETEEEREIRDTKERESGDQNTTQTEEETTTTDQETPGLSSQFPQREGTSVNSSERATETQEDPGATVQMDQDRRQETESTEKERSSTDK